MDFRENNLSGKVNFCIDKVLDAIQPCIKYKAFVFKYFDKCFDDLIMRLELDVDNSVEVTKIVFLSYINLPMIVAERIFYIFTHEKSQVITKTEFVEGMTNLYFGSIDKLAELSFNIFDLAGGNKICSEDVSLVLSYMSNDQNTLNSFLALDECLNFEKYISFEEYLNLIRNKNSNIFVLFLTCLYSRQPFSKEDLEFYNLEMKLTNMKPGELVSSSASSSSSINLENISMDKKTLSFTNLHISEKLLNYCRNEFGIFMATIKRKEGSKNVLQFNSNVKDYNKSLLYSILEEEKLSKVIVYKFGENKKLEKYKLVLVKKSVFSYKYSKSVKDFKLEMIHPLSGYYISSLDETQIKEKTYFPFVFMNKFGTTLANVNCIHFCTNETEQQFFVNELNKVVQKRSISKLYEIFEEELGNGNFGTVKLGREKHSGRKVAIKVFYKNQMKISEMELVKSEIDILQHLKNVNIHKNVVQILDIFEDKNCIYIVMEYLPMGDLNTFIKLNANSIGKENIKSIVFQIASGLNFLHMNGIVHRDLKPENILIEHKNISKDRFFGDVNVKITDFGLSKVIGKRQKTTELYGTLTYSSPEILFNSPYDKKTDIWSLGVIIYYLFFGENPFSTTLEDKCTQPSQSEKIKKNICYRQLRFPSINDEELISLMQKCLERNAKDRIDIPQVLASSWFSKG